MTAPRNNARSVDRGRPAGQTPGSPAGFRGNKQSLPSKPCVACGRPMTWRKRWARNWDDVKYCSDACRKAGSTDGCA